MRFSCIGVACALLAILAGWTGPTRAQSAEAEIRQVVENQIAAFAAGDARRAFGYATPNIQKRFGSSATFMTMVEQSYSVLLDPADFVVEAVEANGDAGAVRARVVGRDGQIFDALYPMKRQTNGDWRIDGCYLQPAKGRAT